ncbi:predicted protein [Sclerotinia sclerotiorum 1980 UF-70]|uniref:Uncharacterized protein n=1 Tax=Sclerotinia sclerotiorum (strain ATCC 18683 / 1980 / Ss-1) TaxID=665079 RepID=A7EQ90_SCLS1|nr:predicted protein [Sclerotinia sclerotiorum 1980 UF-70]EDO05006.1 predicted protein [Sclerotinia sclerotiorum 1980 UF-70]
MLSSNNNDDNNVVHIIVMDHKSIERIFRWESKRPVVEYGRFRGRKRERVHYRLPSLLPLRI